MRRSNASKRLTTILRNNTIVIAQKMADAMDTDHSSGVDREAAHKPDKMFTLKKWNLVAMWSWDVECDTCAICRVQVMGKLSFLHF